jgi:hypothetical protein
MPSPLASPADYESFVYGLPSRHSSIQRSTLIYIASGSLFGRLEGRLFFEGGVVLCVQEFLNFELDVIEGYGYEVSRAEIALNAGDAPDTAEYCRASYRHKNKHHRIAAPDLSFTRPNLPFLIEEIERELLSSSTSGAEHTERRQD